MEKGKTIKVEGKNLEIVRDLRPYDHTKIGSYAIESIENKVEYLNLGIKEVIIPNWKIDTGEPELRDVKSIYLTPQNGFGNNYALNFITREGDKNNLDIGTKVGAVIISYKYQWYKGEWEDSSWWPTPKRFWYPTDQKHEIYLYGVILNNKLIYEFPRDSPKYESTKKFASTFLERMQRGPIREGFLPQDVRGFVRKFPEASRLLSTLNK